MRASSASDKGLPLRLQDLEVVAPGGRRLLAVDALEIPAGTFAALRGPSGAGKSTALHAMAGLVTISQGRVCWGEIDLAGLREPARAAFRRREIGLVFQDHHLFEELSGAGNAAIAAAYAPRADRAGIRRTAGDRLRQLGLDPDAPRRAGTFSGGERQRIAVARALAGSPRILLADEPTASLDRANADALIADLATLARRDGITVVAVSHDPAFHAAADRTIALRDGRIVSEAADA